MSWCNKLASTPAVGFKFDCHFASGDSILEALSPVLAKLVVGDKPGFEIARHQSFDVTFDTDDGFQYLVDPWKIAVTFKHRLRAKPVSGGPPIMEMLSHPAPFTELLTEVGRRTIEAALLISGTKSRTVARVGIISTTMVAYDELPPGIARLIKYLGRPWKEGLDSFNIRITSELRKGTAWSDRCIHVLARPDDPEQLTTLNFDYQRQFDPGRPATVNSLTEVLASAEKASLEYFEELGEGTRFDEEVIGAAVIDSATGI